MGNSSSLPASISKMSTHLDPTLSPAKLAAGPTAASPGPMLLMVATTAVKEVTGSCPYRLTRYTEAANSRKMVMKYTLVERTTSCSMGLPSIFSFLMLLGWI